MNSSRSVTSNQRERHPDLLVKLMNHLNSDFQRPIATIARDTFTTIQQQIATIERPLILDSGCGIGQSTQIIAEQNPSHWVIGIDQSEHRISKQDLKVNPDNMLLVRANCIDFWRLALAEHWHLDKHYLLFPNPWPKKQHLQRRWHGHPVFPTLINLRGSLELRTNWRLYAEEMHTVLDYMNFPVSSVEQYHPDDSFLTPFEKKYHESGQQLYKLMANLN